MVGVVAAGRSYANDRGDAVSLGTALGLAYGATVSAPSVPPTRGGLIGAAMEIPAQIKPVVWGAVGGAILTLVAGFDWVGWHTASSAERMAAEVSDNRVIAALAPFCVDQFRKTANPTQTAALLQLTKDYERGSFLEKGGWTGLPGSKETNWRVGRACGDLLAAAAKT